MEKMHPETERRLNLAVRSYVNLRQALANLEHAEKLNQTMLLHLPQSAYAEYMQQTTVYDMSQALRKMEDKSNATQ